jgi:hypothetical protein
VWTTLTKIKATCSLPHLTTSLDIVKKFIFNFNKNYWSSSLEGKFINSHQLATAATYGLCLVLKCFIWCLFIFILLFRWIMIWIKFVSLKKSNVFYILLAKNFIHKMDKWDDWCSTPAHTNIMQCPTNWTKFTEQSNIFYNK